MRRTLLIFDVDGTLTDSTVVDADCYISALEEALGLRLESADWSQFVDCTDAGIATELFLATHGRPLEDERLSALGRCFFGRLEAALTERPCREIAGAAALLARLSNGAGVTACIATGAWQRSAKLKLGAARINVGSLAFASCDDARNRRDIVRAAIRKAQALDGGGEFDACIAVGDGVWDIQTAAQLGLSFIGIARGDDATKLRRHGAEVVFENFAEPDAFLAAAARLASAPAARAWP